ncbi:MAG: hypothetical protein II823_03470 [Kiritimatiellae bacterium]|nr:hypothetical protein [Kiritimatiellia bacterium]
MNTTSTDGWDGEECPPVTTATVWEVELIPCPVYDPPPFNPSMDGIRDAARRHDAMARRKYAKPFKWFKFNRARRASAK